jgi:hypothetical protein
MYEIQVAVKQDDRQQLDFHDSFVYESIPRSGNGRRLSPSNDSVGGNVDGVSIEGDVGINMAWTQFLHKCDVVVKVQRTQQISPVNPEDVVIRPTLTSYTMYSDGNDLYIELPYQDIGHRISIEFQDDLWTYRGGGNDSLFVQDLYPDGHNYVSEYNSSNPVLGIEPISGLMIFASPFPDQALAGNEAETYTVPQGFVPSLENVTQSNVYFGPGVYWFGGDNHAILGETVSWVHLAPGAFVKGAIEYRNTKTPIVKATGHGVLSGEQYVYQANNADG